MGNRSQRTQLKIENNTSSDIIDTSISEVDNFDWDGWSRPDKNFNKVFIKSKGSLEQREEVNARARNCPFTMTLKFRDGTIDKFRIHQKHAIGCCPGFNHMLRSHDISYGRIGHNLLKITINNTAQQLQNEKAEQLNKEGKTAMSQKNYETAMKKFEEALRIANQTQTIDSINSNINEVKQQRAQNLKAEEMQKEGLEAFRNKNFDVAIEKFDEALKLANDDGTVASIKSNKANVCNELGKICLQKGWELEADVTKDNSEEAKINFDQAKLLFEQAVSLNKKSEYESNFQTTKNKIEGNQLFNEGVELEKEASQMFEEARNKKEYGNYTSSQNKYKEALNKYNQAKEKFDECIKMGNTKFEICSRVISEQVNGVLKVIDNIDKIELNYNVKQVTVENEKDDIIEIDDECQVNLKLQEQIDVPTVM